MSDVDKRERAVRARGRRDVYGTTGLSYANPARSLVQRRHDSSVKTTTTTKNLGRSITVAVTNFLLALSSVCKVR